MYQYRIESRQPKAIKLGQRWLNWGIGRLDLSQYTSTSTSNSNSNRNSNPRHKILEIYTMWHDTATSACLANGSPSTARFCGSSWVFSRHPLRNWRRLFKYVIRQKTTKKTTSMHNFWNVFLSSFTKPHHLMQTMEESLKNVNSAASEYQRQNDLVNLQSQFMGYVDLYAPDRRLVKEVRWCPYCFVFGCIHVQICISRKDEVVTVSNTLCYFMT